MHLCITLITSVMKALIVIDVQNEFSARGKRPVPNHDEILQGIKIHVLQSREKKMPIAWVRHHNRPTESPAFIPGSWGAEFSEGFGPELSNDREIEFQKDVYGAFTGTDLGKWLHALAVNELLIAGFYTHGCVSTTAREAIMREFNVSIAFDGTGACAMVHPVLGQQSAAEVKRTALLQLDNMGVTIVTQ